jgi:hypothetical protein
MEVGAPDLAGRILRAAAGGAAHQTRGHGALGTEGTSANGMTEGHEVLGTQVTSTNEQI